MFDAKISDENTINDIHTSFKKDLDAFLKDHKSYLFVSKDDKDNRVKIHASILVDEKDYSYCTNICITQ